MKHLKRSLRRSLPRFVPGSFPGSFFKIPYLGFLPKFPPRGPAQNHSSVVPPKVLSYRRGRENDNADFLSQLPISSTTGDSSDSSALTDPDDLGVYLICACGYTTPSCPIPGVGLCVLTPPSYNNPGTSPNPFPTPVLGVLHLTRDDFRTHRAPMPLRRMTGPTISPFATSTDQPCLSYKIDDQHEASRSNCARHARSRTAILAGNTSLRPDYRMAACSGFVPPAARAPPRKASFRSSPPPRSARLGSTILLNCLTSPDLTPGCNSQMDNSPPAAPRSYNTPLRGITTVPQLNNSQTPC